MALLLIGCAITPVRRGNGRTLQPARAGNVLVFGRINYLIDGQIKTPYGAFRPSWPAPIMNATRLESGSAVNSHAVAKHDGSFLWELPPGHYVITRIGFGQFTDPTYIAWPRVAFRVPDVMSPVYLGHLVLSGASYTNEFTYSTGRKSRFLDIDYAFEIRDEISEHEARLRAASQKKLAKPMASLMFHDPEMPIGDRFVELWRQSPTTLVERIFAEHRK